MKITQQKGLRGGACLWHLSPPAGGAPYFRVHRPPPEERRRRARGRRPPSPPPPTVRGGSATCCALGRASRPETTAAAAARSGPPFRHSCDRLISPSTLRASNVTYDAGTQNPTHPFRATVLSVAESGPRRASRDVNVRNVNVTDDVLSLQRDKPKRLLARVARSRVLCRVLCLGSDAR